MTMSIGASVLRPSLYIPDIRNKRKSSVLHELVDRAFRGGAVRDVRVLHETLLLRERIAATGIGKGVAVPHARSIAVVEPRIVVARSLRGLDWSAPDDQPVLLCLLVLSPAECSEESHVDLVARAAGVGRLQRNRSRLLEAADFGAVSAVFGEPAA